MVLNVKPSLNSTIVCAKSSIRAQEQSSSRGGPAALPSTMFAQRPHTFPLDSRGDNSRRGAKRHA